MRSQSTKLIGILTILVILLLASGCVEDGDLQPESESVELGSAESVRAEIGMGVGELKVAGGAAELLEADFSYNIAQWKPEVKYSVSDNQGLLTVQQPSIKGGIPKGDIRYDWDIRLNNDVPLELSVDLGAGDGNFELGSLSLTQLELQMGAGETTVDLTGDWKRDLDAHIECGIGEVTLQLPSNVGVRVDAEGAIAEIHASDLKWDGDAYVNDAYGKSEVTLHIDLEVGVGEINLELEEHQEELVAVQNETVQAKVGDVADQNETAQAKVGDTIRVHYTGTLDDGTVFDSSVGREPLQFTIGLGQMIPGFDKGVVGLNLSESKTITIPADQAYGPYRADLVQVVARDQLPPDSELEVGQMLQASQPNGQIILVTITNVTDSDVTLDANHRLAGKNLTFEIQLVEIVSSA